MSEPGMLGNVTRGCMTRAVSQPNTQQRHIAGIYIHFQIQSDTLTRDTFHHSQHSIGILVIYSILALAPTCRTGE